jgi:site-specific recombinase XerD
MKRKLKKLPKWLPPDDRRALLAQPNPRYPTGTRNRAMMAVMLYGGLRCAEVCSLRPRDIDLRQYLITVRGKGSKERVVPITPVLERYLIEWRARRPSGPTFFTTLQGKPVDTRYVRRMVHRYGEKAGIAIKVHPHLLRHTCATTWLNEKHLSSKEVQVLLGHARLSTTELYLHASLPDIALKMRGWSD